MLKVLYKPIIFGTYLLREEITFLMKPFIKSQNSFDQDNITRAVSQGFSINEKHSEYSWLSTTFLAELLLNLRHNLYR